MNNVFQTGDIVRLLPHIDDPYKMRGKLYTVDSAYMKCFSIMGLDDYVEFDSDCFELVQEAGHPYVGQSCTCQGQTQTFQHQQDQGVIQGML